MGCASSKQTVCHNCHAPCAPLPRSYSMHVHHPPQCEGDTYHVVALTSTTLGSLNHIQRYTKEPISPVPEFVGENVSKKFSVGLIEAKTWSRMIEEKIPKAVPKTPTRTPPGEPETINAWELMEGLDDISPPLQPQPHHVRSFSFHVSCNSLPSHGQADSDSFPNATTDSKATSILSESDPDVIFTFPKSLEELPPANLKPIVHDKEQAVDSKKDDDAFDNAKKQNEFLTEDYKFPPRVKDKLVLYFTSLRGVRKTYEDCCHVRVILKSIGVRVDERDVSMHSKFKEELKELRPDGFTRGGGLPKVFIGKRYIGGADEIRKMNEDGQLEKAIAGCEMVDDGGGSGGDGDGGVCEACGDLRFIPCEMCSGSCKIYYEGDYEDEEFDEDDCGFQRCPDCNENGLVRCPICCD